MLDIHPEVAAAATEVHFLRLGRELRQRLRMVTGTKCHIRTQIRSRGKDAGVFHVSGGTCADPRHELFHQTLADLERPYGESHIGLYASLLQPLGEPQTRTGHREHASQERRSKHALQSHPAQSLRCPHEELAPALSSGADPHCGRGYADPRSLTGAPASRTLLASAAADRGVQLLF